MYDRAVSLRTLHGYSIGELVNLCGNDGQRIFDAAANASFLYIAILTAAGKPWVTQRQGTKEGQ